MEPKRLIERLLEAAILFVIACFLIRTGICYLTQVAIPLIIIATIILTVIVIYRTWKKKHDSDY